MLGWVGGRIRLDATSDKDAITQNVYEQGNKGCWDGDE